MSQSSEIRQELLDLAQARGYEVSAPQLARWHRAGLLPRPEQRSLGKGHGTQTVYPSGTGEQLLALCEIHTGERRLLYVAWRLWWAGYDVSLKLVREFLERTAAEWDSDVEPLKDPETGGLSEAALDLLDKAATARYDVKFLRRARKRVGSKRFGTLMAVMLAVASGAFGGYSTNPTENTDEDEQRIIEKGLGLDRKRIGRKITANPSLIDGFENTLREGSRLFGEHPFSEVLTAATDKDLMETRDWARSLTLSMELIRVLAREQPGSEASKLLAMGETIRETGPPEQAILLFSLLMWRLWGPASVREDMDSYHEQTQRVLLGLRELGERQGGGTNSFLHLYAKDARAFDYLEADDENR
jgi:hypothetical protein